MVGSMEFFLSDVFGSERYTGNQLATFLSGPDLSPLEMQGIAREINFSETTFILSREARDGAWPVRVFTPAAEVDFAGHPTLGTAAVIRRRLLREPAAEVVLDLKAGRVPVTFADGGPAAAGDGGLLWMRQVAPVFREPVAVEAMASTLGLAVGDIAPCWPLEQVSTGLPHVIVPVRSLEILRRVRVSRLAYDRLVDRIWARCLLVFCPLGRDDSHDVSVRMFAPALGVAEDPATGSGAGCLAAYLLRHRCLGTRGVETRVGQGHEIGRPSLLHLRAQGENGAIRVEVGGRVFEVARGTWGQG
jgi:trans-2,3-dihydro-3-hydroxyanthranilate isomerase